MIKAIYREREDGDFDFVAAFDTDLTLEPPSNWPDEIADWLRSEGETVLVIETCSLQKLPDVFEGKSRPRILAKGVISHDRERRTKT